MVTRQNRCFRRSRVSARKLRLLLRLFCLIWKPLKIARLTGLNRNSVNFYCRHFCERIATLCEVESPLGGAVEIAKVILAGVARVDGADGELLRKCPFSVRSNVTGR